MAISARAAGSWENGATGLTADEVVAIPAAQLTGDMMLLIGCWKDYAITAQVSGWTELFELADGTSSTGNGTGSMKVGVWYKVATSDAESDPTLDFSTTTNLLGEATILVFQKGSGETWATPTYVTGAINTWGTGGGTTSASSTITVPDGACVVGVAAIRDDSSTFTRSATAGLDAASGVTWNGDYVEYPATHASTTTGNDMSCDAGYRLVTTGGTGITLRQSGTLSATETGQAAWVVLSLVPPAVTGTGPAGTGAASTASVSTKETFAGTAAGTGAAGTASLAAKETFAATVAGTGAPSTASIAGDVGDAPVSGTIVATEAAQTAGIAATEAMRATVAGTGTAASSEMTAAEAMRATAAGTGMASTASLAATEAMRATVEGTGAASTAALTGELGAENVTGEIAGTGAASTASIAAALELAALLAGTGSASTAQLAGKLGLAATLAGAQAAPGATLAGLVVQDVTGTIAGTQARQTASLIGIGGIVRQRDQGDIARPRPRPYQIGGFARGRQAPQGGFISGRVNDDDLVLVALLGAA